MMRDFWRSRGKWDGFASITLRHPFASEDGDRYTPLGWWLGWHVFRWRREQ